MQRRFRPARRRAIALLSLLLLVLLARAWWAAQSESRPETLSEGLYRVERVVDGDTLLLTNRARVRLLGVDAPESVRPNHPVEPFGATAAEFTRRFVSRRPVRLEFDLERLDRYDRFLAYVWVEERLLNEELVRAGLATAELGYRYSQSMKRRFERAQDEARQARRGIWSDAGGNL